MKYAFWNTHKNEDINEYLLKLVDAYRPDFLALSEYNAVGSQLEISLKKIDLEYTFIPKIGSRLDIFYKGNGKKVRHCAESEYYTIKIVPYGKSKQIIAIVHLPCKMYADQFGNEEILRDLLVDVNGVRKKKSIKNVVIVGDFNMNPYEPPMINATGLQAIASREIVLRRGSREYMKKTREFFYNPMWNFLGDEKNPIGSYYYRSPQNKAWYWNTFDQFIVSKDLADEVDLKKIEYINSIGTLKLGNDCGEPTVSDHFPLYFEIGEKR